MNTHNFKVGDRVKVIRAGNGFSRTGSIVTITSLKGVYGDHQQGYTTTKPSIGLTNPPHKGPLFGKVGEDSFELHQALTFNDCLESLKSLKKLIKDV